MGVRLRTVAECLRGNHSVISKTFSVRVGDGNHRCLVVYRIYVISSPMEQNDSFSAARNTQSGATVLSV